MKHSLRTHCLLPFVAMASTLLFLPSAGIAWADQFQYDLGSDWSNAQNPNGAWSYNLDAAPISVFQTFTIGEAGWGYNYLADGSILKTTMYAPGSFDWQPGDIMMHALSLPYGGGSSFLNVTWTSPANGMIDITGRAWDGAIETGRDVAWSLMLDGQTIAQRSSVFGLYRTDASAQFASNLVGNNSLTGIPVTQGEVLEFRVATDTYYGHFVGVQENVTLTTVPEAGTFPLFITGIVGLVLGRRFSPKPRSIIRHTSPH